MKLPFLPVLLSLAACNQADSETPRDGNEGKPQAPAPLSLSNLELTAHAAMLKRAKDVRHIEQLESKASKALEEYLFDPYSVRFRELREGRGGAICGQYNAKNRLGAYVGFRDFVVGKDGTTVYASKFSDGVETELYTSFAEAYVNACATKAEANLHEAQTETYYYPSAAEDTLPTDDLPMGTDGADQLEDPFEE